MNRLLHPVFSLTTYKNTDKNNQTNQTKILEVIFLLLWSCNSKIKLKSCFLPSGPTSFSSIGDKSAGAELTSVYYTFVQKLLQQNSLYGFFSKSYL